MSSHDGHDERSPALSERVRLALLLRAGGPLALAGLALLAGPALLVWWLRGGPFGLDDALIGGAISAALLLALALALGWTIGRMGRGRRR
jgi:hypothetical protein